MAKITYDNPKEFFDVKNKTVKPGWFTFDKQDEICLDVALKLYSEYTQENRTEEVFDKCIDEATKLLTVFYNAKYNPKTRRTR